VNRRLLAYTDSMNIALHVTAGEYEEALALVETASSIGVDRALSLTASLNAIQELRPRSPLLAGLFAVFPGGGHFYAGRTRAGLRSFLVNGAFIALIIFSLELGIPIAAALFILVEAVLYGANIYGGVNAALEGNARRAAALQEEILKLLPAPPLDEISVDMRGVVDSSAGGVRSGVGGGE
jgi:hypothetical protein